MSEHRDCPFEEGYKTLCNIINKVEAEGPMVVEAWRCPNCGVQCWQAHRWAETLGCGNCRHRVASQIPRYTNLLNALPDLRDNGASKGG